MPLASYDFVSPINVVATTAAFFGGTIELDPASNINANKIVGAQRIFSYEENGLKQKWRAKNIYLYPPRDVLTGEEQPQSTRVFEKQNRFQKSAQRVWLEECYRKYIKREFEEAIIFLTSSEVALITTQKIGLDMPLCIMKERPKLFVDNRDLDKVERTRCIGFIFYFPNSFNTEERIQEFNDIYSTLGRVFV